MFFFCKYFLCEVFFRFENLIGKKFREDGNMKFLDCINRRRFFMYLKLYIFD